jgi:acyl-CoA thioesterase
MADDWTSHLLRLEAGTDDDTFVADGSPSPQGRLFGGLIASQALAAAGRTVPPSKLPQSLHLYFVRPGAPGVKVRYEVERTRDGRSFDTRRITARQDGEVILEMLASFHCPEPGADTHPPPPPMVALADTVVLDTLPELTAWFDLRVPAGTRGPFVGPPYWLRSRQAVADDPITRACALTYMSDIALLAAARPPDAPLRFERGTVAASLDHSVWFHRPFHPDRWHRYHASSVNNNDSRGLAVGAFYDEAGSLVATIVQEGLWRLPG